MQNWTIVDEPYLDHLRKTVEPRIPFSDYGKSKFKPFFGVLFECGDLCYVTQISHAQPRHVRMKNSPDFYKIYIPDRISTMPSRFVAVVNLNYMFPIHKSLIHTLEYKNIDACRSFNSNAERSQYIDLLKEELAAINCIGLDEKAKKLYFLKCNYQDSAISKRCFDFNGLETAAINYLNK